MSTFTILLFAFLNINYTDDYKDQSINDKNEKVSYLQSNEKHYEYLFGGIYSIAYSSISVTGRILTTQFSPVSKTGITFIDTISNSIIGAMTLPSLSLCYINGIRLIKEHHRYKSKKDKININILRKAGTSIVVFNTLGMMISFAQIGAGLVGFTDDYHARTMGIGMTFIAGCIGTSYHLITIIPGFKMLRRYKRYMEKEHSHTANISFQMVPTVGGAMAAFTLRF